MFSFQELDSILILYRHVQAQNLDDNVIEVQDVRLEWKGVWGRRRFVCLAHSR